jgi:predicted DNA binding CopG/RHH family protein
MSKKIKSKPVLQTEEEVREYWTHHDSADYLDWGKAGSVTFPNLKPSTQTISIRLTKSLLESIRVEANKRDVPYQSLIKIWLQEKLDSLSK